ncbi:MAG: adenylate/guanylate cyclase domain-containing protein, partial [Chthoniobacterales bacterium]
MDATVNARPEARLRHALLVTALAPVIPQVLGSIFNIWYNLVMIDPLLRAAGLRDRFILTISLWNPIIFSSGIALWVWWVFSLRPAFLKLQRGEEIPPDAMDRLRRRLVHLPWRVAGISGAAWLLSAPVFLISLSTVGPPLEARLLWHLPISFVVSGFMAMTQSFFLVELASHWGLFPVFFRDARADRLKGIRPISLRTRGLMWAISVGICPIGSLLLLNFAPPSPGTDPQWFGLFVGMVGIAFGLCSAVLIGRSVAQPIDQLHAAASAVMEGDLTVQVPLVRADEFGALVGQFNRMVAGLREKEEMRRMFGAHVGRRVAEQILARDAGVGGIEQEVTVMFVDIRSFTSRAAHLDPQVAVGLLNEFLEAMVSVVECEKGGGMINQFMGDGFMALFGVGPNSADHADQALATAQAMLVRLAELNTHLTERGHLALAIGIGLNTGRAIVGSVGSSERMEFTGIGTTVNVASRIESLNKTLGTT